MHLLKIFSAEIFDLFAKACPYKYFVWAKRILMNFLTINVQHCIYNCKFTHTHISKIHTYVHSCRSPHNTSSFRHSGYICLCFPKSSYICRHFVCNNIRCDSSRCTQIHVKNCFIEFLQYSPQCISYGCKSQFFLLKSILILFICLLHTEL